MSNDKIKGLCDRLQEEIKWVESLNVLLAEEKTLLETRQFNQKLEDCASQKQDLAQKIENSAKVRMQIINKTDNNQHTSVRLNEFLEDYSPTESTQVTNLHKKLAEVLATCFELNSVNGQVIAHNRYIRQELVNALSGNKASAINIYNAHGTLSSDSDKTDRGEA
ncbi:MAG: flagellar protein FlgN [Legionella sp.]|uniref:flagellar export chaperone FlgN n=1 Tax=Legionella sp. TaxID=459 RepID=UPI0039E37ECC